MQQGKDSIKTLVDQGFRIVGNAQTPDWSKHIYINSQFRENKSTTLSCQSEIVISTPIETPPDGNTYLRVHSAVIPYTFNNLRTPLQFTLDLFKKANDGLYYPWGALPGDAGLGAPGGSFQASVTFKIPPGLYSSVNDVINVMRGQSNSQVRFNFFPDAGALFFGIDQELYTAMGNNAFPAQDNTYLRLPVFQGNPDFIYQFRTRKDIYDPVVAQATEDLFGFRDGEQLTTFKSFLFGPFTMKQVLIRLSGVGINFDLYDSRIGGPSDIVCAVPVTATNIGDIIEAGVQHSMPFLIPPKTRIMRIGLTLVDVDGALVDLKGYDWACTIMLTKSSAPLMIAI